MSKSKCPQKLKDSCTQRLLSANEQVMHVYSLIHLMDIQKIQELQLMETRKGNYPPKSTHIPLSRQNL